MLIINAIKNCVCTCLSECLFLQASYYVFVCHSHFSSKVTHFVFCLPWLFQNQLSLTLYHFFFISVPFLSSSFLHFSVPFLFLSPPFTFCLFDRLFSPSSFFNSIYVYCAYVLGFPTSIGSILTCFDTIFINNLCYIQRLHCARDRRLDERKNIPNYIVPAHSW